MSWHIAFRLSADFGQVEYHSRTLGPDWVFLETLIIYCHGQMDKWNLITHRWKFGSQNTSIKAWRVVCVHNEISRKLLQINEFPAAKACVKLLPKENELKFCWCWNLLTLWSICPYLWQNLDSLRIHPVKIQLMSTVFMTVRWVIWWHLWWPLKVSITCCVHQLTITNVLLILRSSSLCNLPLLLHCEMTC